MTGKARASMSIEAPAGAASVRNLQSVVINDPAVILTEEFGDAYRAYRRRWAAAGERQAVTPFPIHLDVELAHKCNLSCRHCLERERGWTNDVLDLDCLRDVLAQANAYDCFFAVNLGYNAEPLVAPKLFAAALVLLGDWAGFRDVFVHTNAVGLTPTIRELMLGGTVTHVCMSVDAATARSYRKIRGGNYDRVAANVLALSARRRELGRRLPILRLSFVLTPDNQMEAKDFVAQWSEHVDLIEFQSFVCRPAAAAGFRRQVVPCVDPWRRLALRANGDVYPCCAFSGFNGPLKLGNARETPLAAMWTSPEMTALREALVATRLARYRGCQRCRDSYYTA